MLGWKSPALRHPPQPLFTDAVLKGAFEELKKNLACVLAAKDPGITQNWNPKKKYSRQKKQ
jgi:hypothetical protein